MSMNYGFTLLLVLMVLLVSGCTTDKQYAQPELATDNTITQPTSKTNPDPVPSTTPEPAPEPEPLLENPPQTQEPEIKCVQDWQCSEWLECSESGIQTRACTDKSDCGTINGKPTESQLCTPPVVEPDQIILSGNGQEASDIFELIDGIAIFEMENTGSGHFGIWLLDEMGNNVELLVNEIGPFDGSKIVRIKKKGEYVLDVSAQGDWMVTITQPRPSTASETKTFSGKDQQYAGPFYLGSGLTKFKLSNTGSGHFGVWLLDGQGNNVELLVNEIGPFDGSKAVGISKEGIYYFDISAQGNWNILIE